MLRTIKKFEGLGYVIANVYKEGTYEAHDEAKITVTKTHIKHEASYNGHPYEHENFMPYDVMSSPLGVCIC